MSGTTPAESAAQTRYLSSSAAATLHGKTLGFVLQLPPQHIPHATFMHAFRSIPWQTYQMTTIMQPFQCDLQPQIQETHRTTHTDTTTHCRTQRRNRSRPERPQPPPPHRRGTFHPRLQPLYTEKRKVSCSGFLPKAKAHATFMQPLAGDLQPQIQETHRTAHIDTTTRGRTQRRNRSRPERPQPQLPHRRGTFHHRLQPLYTEKHTVSCSGFLPKE